MAQHAVRKARLTTSQTDERLNSCICGMKQPKAKTYAAVRVDCPSGFSAAQVTAGSSAEHRIQFIHLSVVSLPRACWNRDERPTSGLLELSFQQ